MNLCGYIKIDLQRALLNIRCVITSCIIAFALVYNAQGYGSAVEMARFMYTSVFGVFAMSIAVIPYAASYIDDKQNRYKDQMVLRGTLDRYIISRIITVFMSAFMTFLIGYELYMLYMISKVGVYNPEADVNMIGADGAYLNLYLDGNYHLYILMCGVHLAAMAGLMGIMGLLAAQIFNNRMAVCIFPAIVVSLQDIAVQRFWGILQAERYSLRQLSFGMLAYMEEGNSELRYYFIIACYMAVFVYVIKILNRGEY